MLTMFIHSSLIDWLFKMAALYSKFKHKAGGRGWRDTAAANRRAAPALLVRRPLPCDTIKQSMHYRSKKTPCTIIRNSTPLNTLSINPRDDNGMSQSLVCKHLMNASLNSSITN
ncbi:hypothetical protein B5X24_HaOG214077 [Helicoverpa armigera]|nr:hypothetical protein B5X24_HaOG214077 [Helicoverpa armigera]